MLDPSSQNSHRNGHPWGSQGNLVLGIISYLNRYSARLEDLAAPLRELHLSTESTLAVYPAKCILSNQKGKHQDSSVLYFDPQARQYMHSDASHKGLWTILLHEGQPVTYVSYMFHLSSTKFIYIFNS